METNVRCKTCDCEYEGNDPFNCQIYKKQGECKFIANSIHWNPIGGHAWVVVRKCQPMFSKLQHMVEIERMFNDEKGANEWRYVLEQEHPEYRYEVEYYDIYK